MQNMHVVRTTEAPGMLAAATARTGHLGPATEVPDTLPTAMVAAGRMAAVAGQAVVMHRPAIHRATTA